jgi:glycosyltransferase involved in cell wall biosynthesis
MIKGAYHLSKHISCAAILAARNEAAHIRRALKNYIHQGIDVVVVDNGSTDETVRECMGFLGHGLLGIEHRAWEGAFNLSAQLDAKEAIIQNLPHEWVIHADADEWLQSPVAGESLIAGISRLSAAGYNAINFEEFVFLPNPGGDFAPLEYEKKFLDYYYFASAANRLMRAWKRADQLGNKTTGGHGLTGNIRLAPDTFILRHYIVLSFRHALMKYSGRRFSETDLKKGWHGNRLNLSANKLILPDTDSLKHLPSWDSKEFDRSAPKHTHFWDW